MPLGAVDAAAVMDVVDAGEASSNTAARRSRWLPARCDLSIYLRRSVIATSGRAGAEMRRAK